ncbi:MAG: hypothetical protein KF893_16375 [Caldilineaceae bacterium]|nr:hypothetical protein [Caldilineaceae bacterium]
MSPKITQLYPQLELFSEGEPPRHTLFVMGRLLGAPDQLLLIDPPADAGERFSLAENSAVLFTGPDAPDVALPQLQTVAGGVAHISIGQHLLDIYSHPTGNVIYLPTLKILCGGRFGSDLLLPALAPRSTGEDELEILRRLAQLSKARPLQLYIPHTGSLVSDPIQVMTRLADDVGYLHSLRRVIPAALRRGEDLIKVQQIASTLIPENRRTPACQQIHKKNVETLFQASRP